MQLKLAIQEATEKLCSAGLSDARRDAELLLLHVLRRDRAYLLAHPELVLSCRELSPYYEMLQQRCSGKPMQYITGHQEFWGLDFLVTPAVLIPRPETEHSVEAVLELVKAGEIPNAAAPRILDVGTGSGAIALSLAHELPQARVIACDISLTALEVARNNAIRLDLVEKVEFLESDLLSTLLPQDAGQFSIVVSNPPYVADDDPAVEAQVRNFEPARALFAGPTGNAIYERLIPQVREALMAGGWLVLEIGAQNEAGVRDLLRGWERVEVRPDLRGIPRVVLARKPAQ